MLSALREVHPHCAPGELKFTSWLWNNYEQATSILFDVEYPRGSQLSLCPGEILSPSSMVSRHYAPGELNISSWMRNIITSGLSILFNVECPHAGKSTLIVPQGNSVSPVGYKMIMTSELALFFDVKCPWGSQLSLCSGGNLSPSSTVSCHYAPGELNISSWIWNIITNGLTMLFNVECPRESLLYLCSRRTQYHQLAMK